MDPENTSGAHDAEIQTTTSNYFGVHQEELTLDRFANEHAVHQCAAEILMHLEVCGRKRQFRATLCPLLPRSESVTEGCRARLLQLSGWLRMEFLANRFREQASLFHPTEPLLAKLRANPKTNESSDSEEETKLEVLSRCVVVETPPPQPAALYSYRPTNLSRLEGYQPFVPRLFRGTLCDEGFLLAVAATVQSRPMLESLFADTSFLDRGMAIFRFIHETTKESRFVTVDTLLPTSGSTNNPAQQSLACGATSHTDEFWVALLAKAYATYCGSFSVLDNADTPTVVQHFTGGNPQFTLWNSNTLSAEGRVELWWALCEGTRSGDPMLLGVSSDCPSLQPVADSGLHINASVPPFAWTKGVVCQFAVEYNKDEGRQVDAYTRLHERVLPKSEPVRLVKIRYATPRTEDEPKGRQWSRTSPAWTLLAQSRLMYDVTNAQEDLCCWLTLDEVIREFDIFVSVSNATETEVATKFHRIEASPSIHNVPIQAAYFLVHVQRPVPMADGENGGNGYSNAPSRSASTVPPATWTPPIVPDTSDHDIRFRSIFDVRPPPFILPQFDPDDEMRAPSTRGPTPQLDNSLPSSCVDVNVRISFPSSQANTAFSLLVFRVPTAELVKLTRTLRDANVVSYSLPTNGRVSPPLLARQLTTELSLYYRITLNAGYYNIVVLPDAQQMSVEQTLAVRTPLQLSCTKGKNGEHFTVDVEALYSSTVA